jgi:hypothetical protein
MKSRDVIHHPLFDGNTFSTVEAEIETLRTLVPPTATPGSDQGLFYDNSGGEVGFWTPTSGIEFSGTNLRLTTNQRAAAIVFEIDGAGQAITTGVKSDIVLPFDFTATQWTILANQTGSIVFDVWSRAYASYPPTVSQSITASAKPTVSSSTKGQSSTLTGWTTTFSAGVTWRLNVDSATSIQRATLIIEGLRT